ncbi:MAG TPA: DUF308 domain-containing protein, partial [Ktedonobacterales bacterium]|nr:DUF308 domain-containing protein [Ktedonobacterales bacterium]
MQTLLKPQTPADQEASDLQKIQQLQRAPTETWLLEVVRGVVSVFLGLLFLVLSIHAIHLLLYGLGAYLLVDGAVGVYIVTRRKLGSRRRWIDYILNGLEIAVGLFCLVDPIRLLYVLLYGLALLIGVRGLGFFRQAMHAGAHRAGLRWLVGGLLVAVAILIFIRPLILLVALVAFVVAYALVDGGYHITRGLLEHFAPERLRPKTSATPATLTHLKEIPPNALPTTRRALIFVRRSGASGLGHIAWAYEWYNGWFNAGSVENTQGKPFASPAEMGFWTTHTLDPIAVMRDREYPYDEYKVFLIKHPHPKEAWQTVIWEARTPYSVLRHNCNDVAFDVLRMYGASALIDPAEEIVPNAWYDTLPGYSFPIAEFPDIPLYLRRVSPRALAIRLINLLIPA